MTEEIQRLKLLYETQLQEAEDQYHERCKEIRTKISLLRKQCSHPKTTWHPDPSGNNDSFFACDICGLEAKRL